MRTAGISLSVASAHGKGGGGIAVTRILLLTRLLPMSLVNSVDTQQSFSMDYPLDFLSENGTDWPELSTPPTSWYRYNVWVSGALCTAYGLVFCAGLIGNLLVAVVVLRGSRTMRRCVTNLFLVNLAFADLLVVLACLPFTLVAHLIYPWVMGSIICKLVPYLQGVSVSASVYTLVAVAVERYWSISSPWKKRLSSKCCRVIIGLIWIGSAIITLPWLVVFRQDYVSETLVCTEIWPDPLMGDTYYAVAHLTLCYVLPLVIIAACYALICRQIWCRQIPGSGEQGPPNHHHRCHHYNNNRRRYNGVGGRLNLHRAKIRALRMLGVVVAAFALSWFPLYATFTRLKFAKSMSEPEAEFWEMIMPVAQWLSSANSCVNPLLYHFLDPRFRSGFKQLLCSDGIADGGGHLEVRPQRALHYVNGNTTAAAAAAAGVQGFCSPLRTRFHNIQPSPQATSQHGTARYGNEWV